MAEASENPVVWEGNPPLYAPKLLGAGVRLVRAHWKTLAVVALVLTAATVAMRLAARAVGASTSSADFTLDYFAYEALVALATGVASGLALRVALDAPNPFRLDRGLAAYVALTAAGALVAIAVTTLATAADPGAGLLEVGKVLLGGLGLVAVIYVFTKLLLWPMGLLMGDAAASARRSWAQMHKASWGYIFAMVLAFLALLPIYVILMLPMGGDADTAPVPFVVVEHLGTAVWVMVSAAVAAAVYRARVLGQPLA